jgi:hypothetical protein
MLSVSAAAADSGRFGVIIGGKGLVPNLIEILKDLGVSWVRVNSQLDGHDQDFARYLDAGINMVITFSNMDPANIDTRYGPPKEFPNAGFPFKSKEAYQSRIRDALAPVLPYIAAGRQVWVQCENEIGDAATNPKSRFWRGTADQYLTQLKAFHEVVRSINPSIPVVLSSFPSESLDAVTDPNNPRHNYATKRVTRLLTEGQYDAVDPHFYGCAEDIPSKVKWIKDHMPADKRWITTENSGPDSRCRTTPISWKQDLAKFEQLQAKQVPARLAACADNGGSICLWFSLFNLRGETDVFNHLGLIDQSALASEKKLLKEMKKKLEDKTLGPLKTEQAQKFAQSLRKKPAYEAFKSFVASHR